jgi:twitching motility two-component system response regulator PilG
LRFFHLESTPETRQPKVFCEEFTAAVFCATVATVATACVFLQKIPPYHPLSGATLTDTAPPPSRPAARRVLVVDDSETIRRSAEIFLRLTGLEVILSPDGFDALSKIIDFSPDLILVDIMMPKLDGYQLCQIVRQHPAYENTPIIMLSSKDGVFDRARGRIAGSDQYLTKPFTRDGLLGAVDAHLKPAVAP